jgi:hypothetical protein
MGVAPAPSWPARVTPTDFAESTESIAGITLHHLAVITAHLEAKPAERDVVLREHGVSSVPMWKEIERRWKSRLAADPELAGRFRMALDTQRRFAVD